MTFVKSFLKNGLAVIIAGIVFTQCSGDPQTDDSQDDVQKVQAKDDQIANNPNNILSFNGQLFSIPSPIQTASLIKSSGMEFNSDLTNNASNIDNYTTAFKQSLNLGVYGADFAYISFYGQDQLSLQYMKNLRNLIESLDLTSAIDKKLADRIAVNINNQDSLMAISSAMFRSTDNYLKNSDRNDIASLILTGGFIESLYFSTNLAKMDKSGELAKRIGEEKQTVSSLMNLLSSYDDPNFKNLAAEFTGLVDAFSKVKVTYKYNRPESDPIKKITIIRSESSVTISDKTLDEILISTSAIRNFITE
jgi:hypothetical protein